MARSNKSSSNFSANIGFEAKLWLAADKLRSNMDAAGGSAEYVNWLESVLDGNAVSKNQVLATAWRSGTPREHPLNVIDFPIAQDAEPLLRAAEEAPAYRVKRRFDTPAFEFEIFDTPPQLEQALRSKVSEGNSIRLLSSYSRTWKTRGAAVPHNLPPSMQDFCETYVENGEARLWSRVWNFVPQNGTDYTAFIRAAPGSRMADDPLCEVGCPYAVRGFDYDYVGVLWLDDLVWRDSQWQVNHASVHESGIMNLVGRSRREASADAPDSRELLLRVAQAYRILLTRPLKGAYVWIPDEETRRYVVDSAVLR
jgi:Uncharacterized conserved protein (DUF2075)